MTILTTEAPEKPYSALKFDLLNLEFLHRLRRWDIGGFGDAAIGFKVRGGGAIHQNVGAGPAAAVGNEVGSTAVVALVVHIGDARREKRQLSYIAANQREIVDEPAVDDLAGHRIFGGDALCLGLHFHGLGGAGYFQSQIGAWILTDVQSDVSAYGLLKTLGLGRDRVCSRRNRSEQVATGGVGGGREVISLLLVEKCDLGALDDGARGVGQGPAHGSEVALAEKYGGEQECDGEQ